MQADNIIQRLKGILSKTLPKDASAYIFGSRARGDNSVDSDWDLLILVKGEKPMGIAERGALSMPIYMLGAELNVEINPMLYTTNEWDKRSMTPFYKNVTNDRIKIWG